MGCTEICGGGCGITWTTWRSGWSLPVALRLFSGNFVLTCFGRTASEVHLLVFRRYIIWGYRDIMCDVTALHMHRSCDLLL